MNIHCSRRMRSPGIHVTMYGTTLSTTKLRTGRFPRKLGTKHRRQTQRWNIAGRRRTHGPQKQACSAQWCVSGRSNYYIHSSTTPERAVLPDLFAFGSLFRAPFAPHGSAGETWAAVCVSLPAPTRQRPPTKWTIRYHVQANPKRPFDERDLALRATYSFALCTESG